MPITHGEPLLLYILVTRYDIGVLLAQYNMSQKERVVYYLSCTLIAYELNYP